MVDTVSTNIVFQGNRQYAVHLTNISDGTGESDVIKIDLSSLGSDAEKLAIDEVYWNVSGFTYVEIKFDRSPDVTAGVLANHGYRDYAPSGYLRDTGTGGTGDLLLSTDGGGVGSSYDIFLVVKVDRDGSA